MECFGQVGNRNVERACEHVSVGRLGGIVVLQPGGVV